MKKKLKLITFTLFRSINEIRPISEWGLEIEKKILKVNQTSCQTSKKEFMG